MKINKLKRHWLYLIIGLPFAIFSLAGWQYGAGVFYLIPAVLVAVQLVYPTVVVWWIILVPYFILATLYSFGFLLGVRSVLLGDPNKSSLIPIFLLATVFWMTVFFLLMIGPESISGGIKDLLRKIKKCVKK